MKSYRIKRNALVLLAHWFLVLVFSFGQTPESLDVLIARACPKGMGFTESYMDQHLASWEGYRSVEGLNLVLDRHMAHETTTDVNMACAYLLRNLALSKEQIATTMMKRALREAENEEEPWRLVYLLRQMEKMIDRSKQGNEVVPFIASFLNDKRPTEPLVRDSEEAPRQQRRVCDGATSALINFMEETGLCVKYDSRFGNPGGEAICSKRDEVMQAVVKALQEGALLPVDFWANLPPPRLPKTMVNSNTKINTTVPTQPPRDVFVKPSDPNPTQSKPLMAVPADESILSTRWAIIGVMIATAIGLLWFVLKRRS